MTDWEDDVTDSPSRWVAEHVQRYVATDGSPKHPAWYLNLRDSPEVHLQAGPEKLVARAKHPHELAARVSIQGRFIRRLD